MSLFEVSTVNSTFSRLTARWS